MKTETFKKLGDKRLMEEGIASAFGGAGSSNGEGRWLRFCLKYGFQILNITYDVTVLPILLS